MLERWCAALSLLMLAGAAVAAEAIHVNQVGLLPQGAKWAVVPAVRAEGFALVKAEGGAVVWQGRLTEAATWAPAGQAVRLADFTAFRTPGRYRVQVAGLPPSPAFTIAGDAYAALNAAALKAFYFNRAGLALDAAHAGPWARPAGHPDTQVRVHASAASASRPEGTLISAPRGWYDAGDYNKYVVNSGISTWTLLAAWEHFPAFFRAQRLDIPESANALPDLLDEALWNLDWLLAMQDPADGGVYHKLTSASFDGAVMPHQSTTPRFVVQKTTAAALNFAAVMATASRVMRPFEAQRPGLSARMLSAAQAAWRWAQANPAAVYRQPPDIHTGGYDDDDLPDEFAWAAAELFVSTREPAYLAAVGLPDTPLGVPGWNSVAPLAWVTLAQHRAALPTEAQRRLVVQRVGAFATQLAARLPGSAWRVGLQAEDFHWGSNGHALNMALMLMQGVRLGGPRSQLDAAQALLDHVLGRNPLGLSFVTGFGGRHTLQPHHRPSMADGVAAPVPGFVAGGPNAGHNDARHCPVPYPSPLPALSYIDHDCSYASNEVAINWNAPLVYVTAALQALTNGATK